jgi:hypothetical protein
MSEQHRFHCDFGPAACTIEFSPDRDCSGTPPNLRPKVTWTGQRTAKIFPAYMAWIHSVNAVISETIKRQHAYVIQDWSSTPPHWEFWVYDPDGSKKCVQSGPGFFDKSWIGR